MKKSSRYLILIFIIYLAFVSIGLPDGIIGVAWPAIRTELGLPLGNLGILTTLLLCMSAISSFTSGHVVSRFGTGNVVFISAVMTSCGLLGYSLSSNFLWLLLFTVPLGLGQGAVDSGLNRYVAEHYTSRHMNWVHCFWGVGASFGPIIMTQAIAQQSQWRLGYRTVSIIQFTLAAVLFFSVVQRLWQGNQSEVSGEAGDDFLRNAENGLSAGSTQLLAMFLFFLYSGIEFSIGVWINSILLESRHMPVFLAGFASASFYAMIMVGRLLSGFVVNKIGNMKMIRFGLLLAFAGIVCIGAVKIDAGAVIGVMMTGLGLASVFPCLMHETPIRFKKRVSDRLIGYQVGAACLGSSSISSGIGVVLAGFGLEFLFPILVVLLLAAFAVNEYLNYSAKSEIVACSVD